MRGESVFPSSSSCGSVRTLIPQGFPLPSLPPEAGRTFSLSWLGQTAEVWVHVLPLHLWDMTSNKLYVHTDILKKEAQDPSKNTKWGNHWFSCFMVLDFTCLPLGDVSTSSSPPQCLCLTQVASWKGLELHYFPFFWQSSVQWVLHSSWLALLAAVFVLGEGDVTTNLDVVTTEPDVVTPWAPRPGLILRASSPRKEFSVRAHKQVQIKEENKKRTMAPILLSSKGYLDLS